MASSGKRFRLNADATNDLVTRLQDTQRQIPELVAININEFIGANDMGTSEELTERTQHAQHSKKNGENLAWQVFVTDHLKPEASKGFYFAQVKIRDIPSCLRQSFKKVARRHGVSVGTHYNELYSLYVGDEFIFRWLPGTFTSGNGQQFLRRHAEAYWRSEFEAFIRNVLKESAKRGCYQKKIDGAGLRQHFGQNVDDEALCKEVLQAAKTHGIDVDVDEVVNTVFDADDEVVCKNEYFYMFTFSW